MIEHEGDYKEITGYIDKEIDMWLPRGMNQYKKINTK